MNAMHFLSLFQKAWKSSPLEHEMTTLSHVDVFFNVIAGKCPSIDRKILALSYSYRLMQVQQPHVYVLYDAAKKKSVLLLRMPNVGERAKVSTGEQG